MSATPAESQSPRLHQFSVTIDEEARGLGLHGAYLVMGALTNRGGHDEFDELLGDALDDLDDSFAQGYDVRTDPILAGYRSLHGAVGRSNRDHVASAENLHRLVKMNGTIPRANLLVDVHNLVSLKTRLAISAHDLDKVHGNVRLSLTTGRERFFPQNRREPQVVAAGEYAYVDEANEIICRMEIRPAASTRPDLSTSHCLSIVAGNAAASPAYVRQAAGELVALTQYFCGGFQHSITAAGFGPELGWRTEASADTGTDPA